MADILPDRHGIGAFSQEVLSEKFGYTTAQSIQDYGLSEGIRRIESDTLRDPYIAFGDRRIPTAEFISSSLAALDSPDPALLGFDTSFKEARSSAVHTLLFGLRYYVGQAKIQGQLNDRAESQLALLAVSLKVRPEYLASTE